MRLDSGRRQFGVLFMSACRLDGYHRKEGPERYEIGLLDWGGRLPAEILSTAKEKGEKGTANPSSSFPEVDWL